MTDHVPGGLAPTRSSNDRTGRRLGVATSVIPDGRQEQGSTPQGAPALLLRRFGLPGPEIERRSLELSDVALTGTPWRGRDRAVARRMVYSAGDPEIAPLIRIHPRAVEAGVAALRAGRTIFCDVKMVTDGINRSIARRCGCEIQTAIDDPAVFERSRASGYPRAAEAMLHLGAALDGCVVAIGNAPTALLALLDLADADVARPAVIVGIPVGFVAATEAKEALAAREVPYVTVAGTRGGTPLAVAAVNALLLLTQEADS